MKLQNLLLAFFIFSMTVFCSGSPEVKQKMTEYRKVMLVLESSPIKGRSPSLGDSIFKINYTPEFIKEFENGLTEIKKELSAAYPDHTFDIVKLPGNIHHAEEAKEYAAKNYYNVIVNYWYDAEYYSGGQKCRLKIKSYISFYDETYSLIDDKHFKLAEIKKKIGDGDCIMKTETLDSKADLGKAAADLNKESIESLKVKILPKLLK
jgi:hypothetical protein